MNKFSELEGKTLIDVIVKRESDIEDDDRIEFVVNDGSIYTMFHSQDCCEHVYIESIVGDLHDLLGLPILLAEESASQDIPEGANNLNESNTWTFYKLRTNKGSVDIRWHGSSNGYYSESVNFILG